MLATPAEFFDHARASDLLGPVLSNTEVMGLSAILAACDGWPISWAAYALATAYHETAGTMLPIKEYGGDAYFRRMYDIEGLRPAKAKELGNTTPGDGAKYAGRGYVQLTGKTNYARADKVVSALTRGVSLLSKPDLAMQPAVAAKIMRDGMEHGWFTGKKLADFLPRDKPGTIEQFKKARAIINGSYRADDVAAYSAHFRDGLKKGGWK